MPSKLEQHVANCSYVDSLFTLRAAKIHINCSKEAYAEKIQNDKSFTYAVTFELHNSAEIL